MTKTVTVCDICSEPVNQFGGSPQDYYSPPVGLTIVTKVEFQRLEKGCAEAADLCQRCNIDILERLLNQVKYPVTASNNKPINTSDYFYPYGTAVPNPKYVEPPPQSDDYEYFTDPRRLVEGDEVQMFGSHRPWYVIGGELHKSRVLKMYGDTVDMKCRRRITAHSAPPTQSPDQDTHCQPNNPAFDTGIELKPAEVRDTRNPFPLHPKAYSDSGLDQKSGTESIHLADEATPVQSHRPHGTPPPAGCVLGSIDHPMTGFCPPAGRP